MAKNFTMREIDVVRLAENKGNDADLFLLRRIQDVDGRVDTIEESVKTITKGEKGDKGDSIVGPVGPQGPAGHTPIAGIDFALPKDGRDGRDGRDGESIIGPMGPAGLDGSADTGLDIRDKLRLLVDEEQLGIDDIYQLREELKRIAELKSRVMYVPNGSGTGSGGGGSTDPAGNDTEIQFNDSGSFGADPDFTWNAAEKRLQIGTEGAWISFLEGTVTFPNGSIRIGSVLAQSYFDNATIYAAEQYAIHAGSGAEGTGDPGFDLTFAGGDGGDTGDTNGGNVYLNGGRANAGGTPGRVAIKDVTSDFNAFLDASALSADHNYAFPNKSGIFALLDDIPAAGNFADAETPSGTIDGSNATFTLAQTPSPAASLQLFLNGAYQTAGGVDYTLSGATITFGSAPLTSSIIRAHYRY